jgi:hypothetical protein
MNNSLTSQSTLGGFTSAGTGYRCVDLLRNDLDDRFKVKSGIVNSIAFTKNSDFRFVATTPRPSLTASAVTQGTFDGLDENGQSGTTALMKLVGDGFKGVTPQTGDLNLGVKDA